MATDARRLGAEALGAALLLATVVGSGVMAETLAAGNTAVALLGNTIPTGAILYVLITILGPISGAHFNPAVTFAFLLRGEISLPRAGGYVVAQVLGGVVGAFLAHLMFDLDILQTSLTIRDGVGKWSSEFVATFGLVFVIFGGLRHRPDQIPMLVGLYITAAYWFTASTSFANPAVTIARMLTNTFSGIAPSSAPAFILLQFLGAALAVVAARFFFAEDESEARR